MSEELAISLRGVSKCFKRYDRPVDRLKELLIPGKSRAQEFWALRDIDLDVPKGQTLGIVGRNGSGKSTLLQIIAGTLTPTTGTVQVNGRVSALLELGSGFNPEFTGRQNVFFNGQLLGLTKGEVEERFDEIAAFADIGNFIDQPVKTYSSGMAVRLAFAVAVHVDPELLIVDEALAVGDELFQRKCFSRIESIRLAGATILFVSHSGSIVVELCDQALLIDSGDCLGIGIPKQIVGSYQKLLYAPAEKNESIRVQIRRHYSHEGKESFFEKKVFSSKPELLDNHKSNSDNYDPSLEPSSTISYETHGATIQNPGIYLRSGKQVNNLTRGKKYIYSYKVKFDSDHNNIRFGMLVKTTSGLELGGAASASSSRTSIPFVSQGSLFLVEFEFSCNLNPGVYFLNAGVLGTLNGNEVYLHRLIDIAMFRVTPETENLSTGIIDFICSPFIQLISE